MTMMVCPICASDMGIEMLEKRGARRDRGEKGVRRMPGAYADGFLLVERVGDFHYGKKMGCGPQNGG